MAREERSAPADAGLHLRLRGSIQGVGFRPWVWHEAHALGLRGAVRNLGDGVEIEVFGSSAALDRFGERLRRPPLAGAAVESIETRPIAGPGPDDFAIAPSAAREAGPRALDVALAPDLPLCADCEAELADPRSRRHRYPFIACARCGPRYTLTRALPYDRVRTAMADFPLCPACAAEYRDPEDRRFHAEATTCPACGPALRCLAAGGEALAAGDAALERAVAALRRGLIVAVHGVGGFHLACDAGNEAAVERLRRRKHRPGKPLAIMLGSLADAEKHTWMSAEERALLASEARPIVLLRRRDEAPLARAVAPGSPTLGVMLAYTPLHALLVGDFGGPLVMTSANRSGEPIAYRWPEAGAALAALADLVLTHDREVVAPCDDSVALETSGGPILLRRSRGHVPRPIRLARPLAHTVLALGGHWNGTVCVAHGDRAWLSAHVGDVESPESVARLEATARRWLDTLGLRPDLVAHDLHPGYESTRLAAHWPAARSVGVQHHHAHLAAVLAEHGVLEPAFGLIWDGTGDGGDGSAWGGELLVGDATSVVRRATFRPIALAGGDRAIRAPWRLALALLSDAFDGDPPWDALALARAVAGRELRAVRQLLARDALCPRAHGVGRYFDAVGALLVARPNVTFQGELALALNFLASGRDGVAYTFDVDRSTRPWTIDLRPAVRELVGELLAERPPGAIADRFHATLIEAADTLVGHASACEGAAAPVVALAGGCFQNPILADGIERRLAGRARVLRARAVPPGDGGLALGQAVVADARATRPGEG